MIWIGVLFLISMASATTTEYVGSSIGYTNLGSEGVMVPLGFPSQYMYLYNWISIGFIFLIGASASQRNAEFWAILLPIVSAMFVWWGWLLLPTASQTFGVIICCAILAVAVYIKGHQQEKFGTSGPGNPILNLVFWMIIVQASISFIDSMGLFTASGTTATATSLYNNVQLATDIPNVMETGGIFNQITSAAYLAGMAGYSAFIMFGKILIDIVWFKGLVLSIAPFLANNATVDAILTVFTVAIDFMMAISFFIWFFKPGIGETV
ncbi:MAG: hypothetical protein PHC39_04495 [Proteiniphilum sp.]|nr:hypothetical protein [Proteiniphilum sp.]